MTRLAPHELRDLKDAMRERVSAAMKLGMQLASDPEDLQVLADEAVMCSIAAAAGIHGSSVFLRTGSKLPLVEAVEAVFSRLLRLRQS